MAALPPKEKRPAAMAPRMQTQVQKWAKMTAELGDRGAEADLEVLDDAVTEAATTDRKRKRTKSSRRAAAAAADAKAQALLRAPHRRDRYSSLAVGEGLPLTGSFSNSDDPSAAVPPTCLLCLVHFTSLQQLRDHESLSAYHRRQLHDPAARRAGMQRYARVAEKTRAAAGAGSGDETDKPISSSRIPVHMKRIPRRRGDLAPVYTSYSVPLRLPTDAADTSEAMDVPDTTDTPETAAENADAPPAAPVVLYHHACLLCRRRFRNISSLRLHERESALHRSRTRDPEAVAAAAEAVHIAAPPRPLLRMHPVAPSSGSAMLYRDRARERRLAFGQTGVPGRRTRGAKSGGTAAASAAAPASAPEPPMATSKGAAMLGKMGWSAGLGLGAGGTGATEAIAPTAYMPGVGLGAQGGRLGDAADVAARRTESTYADFVEQTQETARQRFLALGRAEEEAAKAATEETAAATEAAVAAEAAAAAEADEDGNEMETESRE